VFKLREPEVMGKLELETDSPEVVYGAVEPDNLPNIKTEVTDGKVVFRYTFDNIRQAIASLDDILKCVDVAEEVDSLWK